MVGGHQVLTDHRPDSRDGLQALAILAQLGVLIEVVVDLTVQFGRLLSNRSIIR